MWVIGDLVGGCVGFYGFGCLFVDFLGWLACLIDLALLLTCW